MENCEREIERVRMDRMFSVLIFREDLHHDQAKQTSFSSADYNGNKP